MPKSDLPEGQRCGGDVTHVPVHRERMGLYALCWAGLADQWYWWIELENRRICGGERNSKRDAQRAARSMMRWIAEGRRV